ncbi:MAG: PilN domain-containing protein [Deltaproteobacteria bacterium]|nr:MAG: PilN domain-containing protein [Deltaproteobacteria bacterium]
MIRINLLPAGRRPMEEKIRREVSLFFLLIFFSLAVMAYLHVDHSRDIKRLTKEKTQTQAEITRYRGRQKQLKALEKKQKVLKQKLAIIDNLRKNRDLSVRLLDELASRIPADKMWFRKLSRKGNTVSIEGVARGNETIAQFMESLAKSPYINPNRVVLKQSRQEKIKGFKLKGFNLTCQIVVPVPEKTAPEGKAKTKKKDKKPKPS